MASSGWYKVFLAGIKYLLLVVYKVLPVYSPHAQDLEPVSSSLRAEITHLPPFLGTIGYTVVFSLLLYLLTVAALRKRRLI